MIRLILLAYALILLAGCYHSGDTWPQLRASHPAHLRQLKYNLCGTDQFEQERGIVAWHDAYEAMNWHMIRGDYTCTDFGAPIHFYDGPCPGDEDAIACVHWFTYPGTDDIYKAEIELTIHWYLMNADEEAAVIAHEWGHVLGFNDIHHSNCPGWVVAGTNSPSIMANVFECTIMEPYPIDGAILMGAYGFGSSGGGLGVAGSYPDYDFDTVPDADDNCISAQNRLQEDTDRDGQGNACDQDDDGDGFPDGRETYLGTDRADSCRDVAAHDAWPLDITIDGRTNTIDVGTFVARLGGTNPRHDFDGSGIVTVIDVGKYVGNLGRNCLTEQSAIILDIVQAVEPYGDWTQAVPDGFAWGTSYKPDYGTWMVRELSHTYNPNNPTGLIYRYDSSGQERLAGAFFVADSPATFGTWRHYTGFCIDQNNAPSWPNVSEASCNGVWWSDLGYGMVIWFDNPSGTFAEANPDV